MNSTSSFSASSSWIGNNRALHDYCLSKFIVRRTGINVMAGIGMVVFSWLLAVAYKGLNRHALGWAYLIPAMISFQIARFSREEGVAILFSFLQVFLYVAGWVHANRIFSEYRRSAENRMAVIDAYPEPTADQKIEKGILRLRVLGEEEAGLKLIREGIAQGGSSRSWIRLAADVLEKSGRKQEAQSIRNLLMPEDAPTAIPEAIPVTAPAI